jgi:predicted nucleic acid-binding protein
MAVSAELALLDTSVVLHLLRGNKTAQRIDAELGLRARSERPLISVVTVGEALAFARYRNWGSDWTARLEAYLRELVVVDIQNSAVLQKYAELHTWLVRQGRTVGDNDVWIAATAAAASALLVTTDGDFDPLNPERVRVRRFAIER